MNNAYDLHAIAAEISAIGKWAQSLDETPIDFISRYAKKVLRWPDRQWDRLSFDAQNVINSLAKHTLPHKKKSTEAKSGDIKKKIKELVLDNPLMSASDVYMTLTQQGVAVSFNTIQQIRGDFIHTLHILLNEGLITEPTASRLREAQVHRQHVGRGLI